MAKGWTTIKTNALGGVDKKTVKAFDKEILSLMLRLRKRINCLPQLKLAR